MKMFFKVVKDGFNLGPTSKELPLAFGHDLLLLRVMRWGQDTRAEGTSYLLVQGYAAVAAVTDSDAGMFVHQIRYGSAVVDIGTRESNGTQLAVIVDACVQFEAIVFALPIVPSVRHTPGYPVPLTTYQLTDGQHCGIHEAKLCFAL